MNGSQPAFRVIDLSPRAGGAPCVLIVRLSAVGDCVQTMPLAAAIRRCWPDAHLTWVVEQASAPLVMQQAAIDRVIVLPKRFAQSPRTLFPLRSEFKRQRYDLSFDPQGLTKSGLVAWLSGAPRRIGFARPAAREINPWLQTECVVSRAMHRVDRYLELLRPLGVERPGVEFGLSLPSTAAAMAEAFIASAGLRGGYAVLNPGAGWDAKRWPVEQYAVVARHLASRGMAPVVAWGGNRERQWAETIVAASGGAAILLPPTSLVELAAVLGRAVLFVGSDTGPLHLAAALGTPSVALFGASDAAACGPYGEGHVVLQQSLDLSSGRKQPGADNWAMRKITTTMVCAACDRLLDGLAACGAAAQAPRAA